MRNRFMSRFNEPSPWDDMASSEKKLPAYARTWKRLASVQIGGDGVRMAVFSASARSDYIQRLFAWDTHLHSKGVEAFQARPRPRPRRASQ
jgi:hypothetical protein